MEMTIKKHDFFVEATEPKRPKPVCDDEIINKQIIEASLQRGCGCQKRK